MAHVRLEGVSKSYDGRNMAVDRLDLECPQGEMLALLGPSGCGKSSTLKMIAGIEPVTQGAIWFDDRQVQALDSARRNVAMVFEDYALYPHLSVRGNIAFPLQVRGMAGAEVTRRVAAVVDLLGLGPLVDQPVRSLSGGAQQRVSIGRALVREPALVMFDEPLSHLDADQKVILRTEIRRLQSSAGLTSVLVTHDQTEAMAMADRIAVMDAGVLQQLGSPVELYEDPANVFVARFIGEPPMNLLPAQPMADWRGLRLEGIGTGGGGGGGGGGVGGGSDGNGGGDNDGITLPLNSAQASALRAARAGARLTIGIRPEHLSLPGADAPPARARLAAIVFDRECGGDRTLVRLRAGDHMLVADLPGVVRAQPGERMTIAVSSERLHFFDADTGASLIRGRLACAT